MDRIGVVIVAGGQGLRVGGQTPKQFMLLAGRPVLAHTLERFASALPDAEMVVALPVEQISAWETICKESGLKIAHRTCAGGVTRAQSVQKALAELGPCDIVLVHDGVRPLITFNLIQSVVEHTKKLGNAVPVIEPADSFRQIDDNGGSAVVDRSRLRAVQTPQGFHRDTLIHAYAVCCDATLFTDDASVVEHAGGEIHLIPGDKSNIKLTVKEDFAVAEALLQLHGMNRN